jgi:hypothetical protein
MSSDIALIALGSITQVTTFVIGVMVGRVSRRNDHDDSNGNTEEFPTRWRHYFESKAIGRSQGVGASRAGTSCEAGAYERAAQRWHNHRKQP